MMRTRLANCGGGEDEELVDRLLGPLTIHLANALLASIESTLNIRLGVCQSLCLFPTTDLLIPNIFTINNTTNKVFASV